MNLIQFRYQYEKEDKLEMVTVIAENDDKAYQILQIKYPEFAKKVKAHQYEAININKFLKL